MTDQDYLQFTINFIEQIYAEKQGMTFETSDRTRVSSTLLDLSIEHAHSVLSLTYGNAYGSSLALLRPMFEAFGRGLWFQHCAAEKDIIKFIKKDRFPLNFNDMLADIEKSNIWPPSTTALQSVRLNNFHSFTHGGTQILARRIQEGKIRHVLKDGEIEGICRFVVIVALLGFYNLVVIANDTSKKEFIDYRIADTLNIFDK